MKLLGLFSIIIFGTLLAHAGQDRGGGFEARCKQGNPMLADLMKVDVSLLNPHFYDDLSVEDLETGVYEYILKYRPQEAKELITSVTSLCFKMTDDKIPQFSRKADLSFFERVFDGCKESTLAIQTKEDNNVLVYRPRLSRLSKLEQVLFKVHEGYVKVGFNKGQRDLNKLESFAMAQTRSIYADFRRLKAILLPLRPSQVYTSSKLYLGREGALDIVMRLCASNLSLTNLSLYWQPVLLNPECIVQSLNKNGFGSCKIEQETFRNGPVRLIELVNQAQNCQTMD